MNKQIVKQVVFTLGLCSVAAMMGHAASLGGGTAGDVDSFFSSTASFVIRTIGGGVFILGLAGAGIKMSAGDQDGMRKAIMVVVGGAITFLAPTLANVLKSMAGQ